VGLAIKNSIPQSELIDREAVGETTSCNFLCGGVIRLKKLKHSLITRWSPVILAHPTPVAFVAMCKSPKEKPSAAAYL
jgi:hypothetical protein